MAPDRLGSDLLSTARRIYLVGIAGSGMRSLATLLMAQGKQISGSDLDARAVAQLARLGMDARPGHRADYLGDAQLVITSAAAGAENPELREAARRGIPVLTHAQALGALMRGRLGVAVAGTHGKTTTTALLGFLLTRAGYDPTVLVGASAVNFNGGARRGDGPHVVVEADEYHHRFLELEPWLAVITSIEPDHLDYFGSAEAVVAAFRAFAERVAPDGVLVTCADDPVLARLELPRRRLSYGESSAASWRLVDYAPTEGGGCRIEVATPHGRYRGRLRLVGRHNARNAVAALAAAAALGAEVGPLVEALPEFAGTERRFQTVWRERGIWIVDDYAHHPTAVRATLEAAREIHRGRLWAVFQPHTTSRLVELFDEFRTCFASADRLTLLPIYRPSGREPTASAISSDDLARAITNVPVETAASLEEAAECIRPQLQAGDLLLVMGAGDVTRLSRALVDRLSAEAPRCS